MKLGIATILVLIFAVGALEFGEDKPDFAQIMRGLATMGLAVVGLVLNAF